jgi:hypothetical protein
MVKLEALAEYAAREEIFSSLTTPEPVQALLLVMSIVAHVVRNETEVESYDSHSIGASLECASGFCRENCQVCTANCELHRLRTGVRDLTLLLETDYLSECEVCVDTAVQTEAGEIRRRLRELEVSSFLQSFRATIYVRRWF